jgi:hypothetical protein
MMQQTKAVFLGLARLVIFHGKGVAVVPKASAITAKVIVMVNFCINNQYCTSYIFISLAFLGIRRTLTKQKRKG